MKSITCLILILPLLFTSCASKQSSRNYALQAQVAELKRIQAAAIQTEYEDLTRSAELASAEPELTSRYYSIPVPEHEVDGVVIEAHERFIEIVE